MVEELHHCIASKLSPRDHRKLLIESLLIPRQTGNGKNGIRLIRSNNKNKMFKKHVTEISVDEK